ncbi:MAG: hypothetical protein HYY37_06370 [Candidatus Aenigmarchaeota archaeon]|nr:hypothetical protein [Candidatus Aenigmarchaeota archaeon]
MAYLLDDGNFFPRDKFNPLNLNEGQKKIEEYFGPDGKYLGHAVCAAPFEMYTEINPTTPPGGTTGMLIGLMFQLRKWEFRNVERIDEWIEVNPVFAQLYQLTIRQKEEMESRIKSGLASAAQAVADLELIRHDYRKYKEFLDYFGLEYNEEARTWENGEKKKDAKKGGEKKEPDEHALKAMFIDLVDVHTGEGISMRSIVGRWPTLIVDFLKLSDDDTEPDKVKEKLDISKAEAVVLVTKNKLYKEWKKLFEPEIKSRFEHIVELVKSRDESVKWYRNWLTPVIARHKLIEEGLATRPDSFPGPSNWMRGWLKTVYYSPTLLSHASAASSILLWAWRDHPAPEIFREAGSERLARERLEGTITPYDDWTKKHLIFHKEHGLWTKYNWITDEWVKEQLKAFESSGSMVQRRLYYAFFHIWFLKFNMRFASGAEVEDTVYHIDGILMSRNVLFVKYCELQAKKEELNRYVNNLLGVKLETPGMSGTKPVYEENKFLSSVQRALEHAGMVFKLSKGGPYERDFQHRISKVWLHSMASQRYAPIVNYIKEKIGMGVN